jgi:hypothetical protein
MHRKPRDGSEKPGGNGSGRAAAGHSLFSGLYGTVVVKSNLVSTTVPLREYGDMTIAGMCGPKP